MTLMGSPDIETLYLNEIEDTGQWNFTSNETLGNEILKNICSD